jgi:hypothetical protein
MTMERIMAPKVQTDSPHCSACSEKMELPVLIPRSAPPTDSRLLFAQGADVRKTISLRRTQKQRSPVASIGGARTTSTYHYLSISLAFNVQLGRVLINLA